MEMISTKRLWRATMTTGINLERLEAENVKAILTEQIETLSHRKEKTTDLNEKVEIESKLAACKETLYTIENIANIRSAVTLGELRGIVNNKAPRQNYPTGLPMLDNLLGGGIQDGMMINIVGESGSGKSTLAIQMLLESSKVMRCYFASLEMSDRITLQKIDNLIGEDKCEEREVNLLIDRDSRNIEELKQEITIYAKHENPIKLFVIDSKMKVDVSNKANETAKLEYMSKELTNLCHTLDISIVLINQVSKESLRGSHLSIKGSDAFTYDSDVILFINKIKNDEKNRMLKCTKNHQNDKFFEFKMTMRNSRIYAVDQHYEDTEVEVENTYRVPVYGQTKG